MILEARREDIKFYRLNIHNGPSSLLGSLFLATVSYTIKVGNILFDLCQIAAASTESII